MPVLQVVTVAQGSAIRGEQRSQRTILESIESSTNKLVKNAAARPIDSSSAWPKLPEDLKIEGLPSVAMTAESGVTSCSIAGVGKVALRRLSQTHLTAIYLQTYRNIQAGAYVEKFYGVFEVKGAAFAVLQDLSAEPTLAQMCANGTLPTDFGDRLNLCCDISKSVAWFHRAEIQVKSLSDTDIVMSSSNESSLRPILTGLESSRLVGSC